MKLPGVVLVAAQTSRSQAYIQALAAAGLHPEAVVLLGPDPAPQTPAPGFASVPGLLLPDLGQPVAATCSRAGIPVHRVPAADVNSDATMVLLRTLEPAMAIYSGPGGQIVAKRVLEQCRFLHLHSGWLPDYRGSTTLYYALLNGDPPSVTALFLDSSIDTGPVLARRSYPRPPAGLDLDGSYDAAIRADLLVHLMREYLDKGDLAAAVPQDHALGSTYYVIHPVLKHLALLSLAAEREQP